MRLYRQAFPVSGNACSDRGLLTRTVPKKSSVRSDVVTPLLDSLLRLGVFKISKGDHLTVNARRYAVASRLLVERLGGFFHLP